MHASANHQLEKPQKSSLEQCITLNCIPQTIRTDKGTAFTGKEFRELCKSLNIKLIYGTPYDHTPTCLVGREIKTLKDYMKTSLWDGCILNESLSQSLNAMRTTVHSSIKETPFERQYGRNSKTELKQYLNVSLNHKTNVVSGKPDTLQVYSFSNNEGHYDQLINTTSKVITKPNHN